MRAGISWCVSWSRAFNGQPCPLLIALNKATEARGPGCEILVVERHSSCRLLLDIDMKSTPSGGSTTWFSACVYFLYFLCMKWSQSSLCFSVIRLDFIRLSSKLGVKWVRSGPARPSWISLFLSLSLSLYAGSVLALLCSVEVVALNGSEAMHSVWVPERDI